VVNRTEVDKAHVEYAMPAKHKLRPVVLPPDFDPAAYLKANPDVAAAKADPRKHYLDFGYREGRPLR
jgi:hypothetical protein